MFLYIYDIMILYIKLIELFDIILKYFLSILIGGKTNGFKIFRNI